MVNLRFKSIILSLIMLFAASNAQACNIWRKYKFVISAAVVVGAVYCWWTDDSDDGNNDIRSDKEELNRILDEEDQKEEEFRRAGQVRRISRNTRRIRKQGRVLVAQETQRVENAIEESVLSLAIYINSQREAARRIVNNMKISSPTIAEKCDESEEDI